MRRRPAKKHRIHTILTNIRRIINMATLNFREFRIPAGISRREVRTADVREEFADILYTRVGGIRAHALALKIYNSGGAEEYSAEETGLIRSAAERHCLPCFIDGLYGQLEDREGA